MPTPLDRKITQKQNLKRHVTLVRVPKDVWSQLKKLSKKTKLTVNAIMNVAIKDLVQKERSKLSVS